MDQEIKGFQEVEQVEEPEVESDGFYSVNDVMLAQAQNMEAELQMQPVVVGNGDRVKKILTMVAFDSSDAFLGSELYSRISGLYFVDKRWVYRNNNLKKIKNIFDMFLLVEFVRSPFREVPGLSEQSKTNIRKLGQLFANNYVILPFIGVQVERGQNTKAIFKFNGINLPRYQSNPGTGSSRALNIRTEDVIIHLMTYGKKSVPISDAYKIRMRTLPTVRDFVNNTKKNVKVGYLDAMVKDIAKVQEDIYTQLLNVFND